MSKNIELELRAEVKKDQYAKLLSKLKREYKLISHTQRLSVMYFGKVGQASLDVRVRITNSESEVAIKKGALHAHDRIEMSQPIDKSQFMGMAQFYSLFDFKSEVAERETHNFDMGRKIVFSLVKAGDIAYVEIEKMSSKQEVEKNKEQLQVILDNFNLKTIATEKEFNNLCDRLSEHSDWLFTGSKGDMAKLKKLLAKY